jgi:16S rRNA (guanine966-N2)-methyltransferase
MGQLRINGGELRGRRLRVPPGETVRPTPDRVREALFDILGPSLAGARALDLYAGSGALGLEALSRGASHAAFVEVDERALAVLSRNVADLGVGDRCAVVPGRAETVIQRGLLGGPFDLVLADPPYAELRGQRLLDALAGSSLLAPGARIVFQRDRRTTPARGEGTPVDSVRTARYGRTSLDFFVFYGKSG